MSSCAEQVSTDAAAILHAIVGTLLVAPLASMAGPASTAASPEYSIPFVDHGGIRNWQADGGKGVWIQAAGGRWYYASFSSPCSELPFSSSIRFIPEPAGDLSRWSSIRLAHAERCFFRSLQPSEGPPKKGGPAKPSMSSGSTAKSS